MLFFHFTILVFCVAKLETATIRDFSKNEGDGTSKTVATLFEYPLEISNEYIKICIFSKSKLPDPFPDPRTIWNRTVPFIIFKRSSLREKEIILGVIQRLNRSTCMNFVEGSDYETFIIITPKRRFSLSDSHHSYHHRYSRRNFKNIREIILHGIKFVLDFGLSDGGEVSTDQSIRNLNNFLNCELTEDSLSNQTDEKRRQSKGNSHPWIHLRRKRRSWDYYKDYDDYYFHELEFSDPGNIDSSRTTDLGIEDSSSDQMTLQSSKHEDIIVTVKSPIKVDKTTFEPPTYESKTIGDSISLRRNEKGTSVVSDVSTSVTGATSKVISSTVSGVVIKEASSTVETPTNAAVSSTAAVPVTSSLAVTNGKASTSSGNTDVTSGGPLSTATQTVTVQPMLGDTTGVKEPPINLESSSLTSRNLRLSKGGKEVIVSDSKVIVVDQHAVQEHEIGTEHLHLPRPSGIIDEDEEHDGYHRVDVIDGNPIQGRTALRDPTKLWTDGVIPYMLSEKYDQRQKQLVIEGMEEFRNKSCVRFVERTNEKSYMFLQPDSRCSATIGKIEGKPNNVTISDGCFVPGIIVHELMHVMGFIHEQNRPDRDKYVMIVWSNIIPKTRGNFKKYRKGDVQDFGVGYDYDSVMHYGMYDFAVDFERPTIIPLKPGANIGQRDGFSKKDLIKLNKLFKCDESAGGTDDEDEGYEIEFRRRPKVVPRSDFKKKFLKYLKKVFKAIFVSLQQFGSVEI